MCSGQDGHKGVLLTLEKNLYLFYGFHMMSQAKPEPELRDLLFKLKIPSQVPRECCAARWGKCGVVAG
jgi:hypothetical protein